ncbi:MAG TPA: RsmE family RNA methyltransferase [Acidimicrobiales bacterium]|nr:RsmE family RNA methyltransferase [Acidimicrobiales bacterium]
MLPEWSRRVAALGQFHVADPATPILSRDDEHHLRRVLRANAGEEIVVTNGAGDWSFAVVTDAGLERVSDVVMDPKPAPITLYLAPVKGERGEWAVAKSTELGVTRVVPLVCARLAVAFRGDFATKTLARWRRIARESAGQCRRTYDVVIDEPVRVADVPAEVAVADFGGTTPWAPVRAVAIGPEGGWAPGEWDEQRTRVGLGSAVLRAETAAVAATTLMVAARDGWARTATAGNR